MSGLTVAVFAVPENVAGSLERASREAQPLVPRELLTAWAALRDEIRTRAGSALYDELVAQIRVRVSVAPHFVVVRGLHFDPEDRLLVGLCAALGDLVYADRGEDTVAVDVLRPQVDLKFGALTEKLHTDGVSWKVPNRLTALQFVTVEQGGGGESLLVSGDEIVRRLRNAGRISLLKFLNSEPLAWRFGSVPPAQVGCLPVMAPVLEDGRIRWLRDAVGARDDLDLSGATRVMLEEFEVFLHEHSAASCFSLLAGDLLILDNWLGLHGRRPVREARRSRREVRRVRLAERANDSLGAAGTNTPRWR